MPPKPETFLALLHSVESGESLVLREDWHFWNGVVRTFRQRCRVRQMRQHSTSGSSWHWQ